MTPTSAQFSGTDTSNTTDTGAKTVRRSAPSHKSKIKSRSNNATTQQRNRHHHQRRAKLEHHQHQHQHQLTTTYIANNINTNTNTTTTTTNNNSVDNTNTRSMTPPPHCARRQTKKSLPPKAYLRISTCKRESWPIVFNLFTGILRKGATKHSCKTENRTANKTRDTEHVRSSVLPGTSILLQTPSVAFVQHIPGT